MGGKLTIGKFELLWLKGGRLQFDGGAMFGVVPKVMWSKKYPSDAEGYVTLIAYPILIRTPYANIVIESGIGNKLTDKQKQIFRVTEEWDVPESLKQQGLSRNDIDYVILTHYDFDHAGGVVMQEADGTLGLTFPKAKHIVQKREWEDVLNPNKRSINTYWPINNELLRNSPNLMPIDGSHEVVPGVNIRHTGGHTRGHQAVLLESNGEKAIHIGDLSPVHAYYNPLWITAYDNFPLDSVQQKEELQAWAVKEKAWYVFYHDPYVLAAKFDERGTIIQKIDGPLGGLRNEPSGG